MAEEVCERCSLPNCASNPAFVMLWWAREYILEEKKKGGGERGEIKEGERGERKGTYFLSKEEEGMVSMWVRASPVLEG